MSGIQQARYKGARIRDPSRFADEYVAIDEVIPLPAISVTAQDPALDPDKFRNSVDVREFKFRLDQFTPSSLLLERFFLSFTQFRCRSAELIFSSVKIDDVNIRYETGIYWAPNHNLIDKGLEGALTTWNDFEEKPRTSMISHSAAKSRFNIKFIPQIMEQEEAEEDVEDIPNVPYPYTESLKSGWLPCEDAFKNFEHRTPYLVVRRPLGSVIPVGPIVLWTVQLRCIWEFRHAKTGV